MIAALLAASLRPASCGHGVATVDLGFPTAVPQQVNDREAHRTNRGCTISHAVEGKGDFAAFVHKPVRNDSTILRGVGCLADVDAFAAAR
ncbi:MAG: hypothetical protein MUF54_04895 [Polyangiaceae bacterium]|nr:hypothetical protein [Polyangiaceae bacterium]